MGKKLSRFSMTTYQDVVADYSPEYCSILEACYRNNMMSEGGGEAIRAMLEGLDLAGKHVLDFAWPLSFKPHRERRVGRRPAKLRDLAHDVPFWRVVFA